MSLIETFREKIVRTKVLENFTMMSLLNVANAVIGFVVYPFVIKALGLENYGHYVLSITISYAALLLINFGFDLPATKRVVECRGDLNRLADVVSGIFTYRFFVWLTCTAAALIYALHFAPNSQIAWLAVMAIAATGNNVFFATFYYQGIKQMKVVTCINLLARLTSIPCILIWVKTEADTLIFGAISALAMLTSGLISHAWITLHDHISVRFVPLKNVTPYVRETFPFFVTSISNEAKDMTVNFVINSVFGAASLAIYDLATKILTIPRSLMNVVNNALFPEMVNKATPQAVRSMMKYETILGVVAMLAMIAIGYPAVLLLGGRQMLDAYALIVVGSATMLTWLWIGIYLKFVFIPAGRYFYISINQFVALISAVVFLAIGLTFWQNPMTVMVAIVLSSVSELVFCATASKRLHLL